MPRASRCGKERSGRPPPARAMRERMMQSADRDRIDPAFEISVEDTRAGMDAGRLMLIDIREAEELAIASIEGAVWIPMGELGARINEIDAGEAETIALVCHTGRRSLSAAVALQRAGFEEVRSVAGGIEAWSRRIDPGVPRY